MQRTTTNQFSFQLEKNVVFCDNFCHGRALHIGKKVGPEIIFLLSATAAVHFTVSQETATVDTATNAEQR